MAEAEGCPACRARHYGLGVASLVDLARGAAWVGAAGEARELSYRAVYHEGCVPVLDLRV